MGCPPCPRRSRPALSPPGFRLHRIAATARCVEMPSRGALGAPGGANHPGAIRHLKEGGGGPSMGNSLESPGARKRERTACRAAALLLFLIAAVMPCARGEAAGEGRCEPTPPDMEGPFYRPGAPERASTGSGLIVRGRILGVPDCRPLPDARIEWWHAGASGEYDDAHRGSLKGNRDGSYRFSTDFPGKYPGRPPHIHFKIFAPGYRDLTTQLYLRGGEKEATFDFVLRPLAR